MSVVVSPQWPNLLTISHPLVAHKLTLLRDKATEQNAFKALMHEITLLIAYEATQDWTVAPCSVATPMQPMEGQALSGKQPTIVPILRAGLGMVEALCTLLPHAKVGHLGVYRDHDSLQPKQYYFRVPSDVAERSCLVCDPMLATGGTAVHAVTLLKEQGVRDITFVCVLVAPEGMEVFAKAHPDVTVYTASLEASLNDQAYILPGLGDAGDRLFGTC